MKVVCHIGHHKTGTSTLQSFLAQNSNQLLQAGILYPWVESQGASKALAKAMGEGDRQEILPFNIREAHNALAFRMLADSLPSWKVPRYHGGLPHSRQMLMALSNQLEALQPKDVVICSEVMSHFGKIAVGQIGRLRQEGLWRAKHFTLWCTLRRPDDQLVSWHGQQVRFGQAPAPLSDPEKGLNLHWLHVDYRGVIEPWLQEILDAEVTLRPYSETLAAGGSVEDFLVGSGLGLSGKMLPAKALNVSLKPAVISLLRRANARLPEPIARELAESINDMTVNMTLAATSEVEFLGPVSRAQLVAHFAPIHEWLSQTSGQAAFFTDMDEMAQCRPISEKEALQSLLDQLTPHEIAEVSRPEIRDFLTGVRAQGATL
jgi:hypothetical protein